MKKFLAFFLCLCLALSFSGCNVFKEAPSSVTPDTNGENTENGMAATEPDINIIIENADNAPSASEGDNTALNDFMSKLAGIWIIDGTVDHMYESEYCFEFYTIENGIIVWGVYPGSYDRPGKIVDCEMVENLIYRVELLFEAGEYMGDILPEERLSLQITLVSAEKIVMKTNGVGFYCVYGGKTLDEAKANAKNFMK